MDSNESTSESFNEHTKDKLMMESNHAMNISEILGASIMFLIYLGKVKYTSIETSKNRLRNILIGWFTQILFVATLCILGGLYLYQESH